MKTTRFLFHMLIALVLFVSCSPKNEAPLRDLSGAIYQSTNYSIDERVENLLGYMTLQEKIGQMTQVDRQFLVQRADIKTFYLGSLLSGGGSAPLDNSPESWANMVDKYQTEALETPLGIPLLYGIDAVHGHNIVVSATIYPHNIGLGAAHDADLVKRIAQATAQEMAATGIYWNFGPCVTVPQDERWGRTYEGFSESAELVARLGTAAIEGYQGNDLADPGSVMATAKHFVADGGTLRGRDQGNARIDEEELRRIHLFPYEKAIDASVGSIMASFSSWNGEKVHGSEYLLTQLLKEEMGFQGLLVSDWKALEQLPGSYNDQVAAGINAGIDMVMVPDNYPRFIETLTKLVEQEKVPLERIDDAVRRILKAKMELSLWQRPLAQRQFLSSVGSEEHRTLAREAVKKSLVLLNNDGILPLSGNLRGVIITGALADNLGAQCGGWTISWQGEQGDITWGTTIKEALSSRLGPDVPLYHSLQDAGENPVDAMIMVLGEMPYAEMMGDREDLTIPYAQILPIQQAKEQGIPVITILISGRPMILGELLNLSDGLIAAWLPGSEGAGVTDVIFGDFNPTGKLSYTWPRSMDQIPINLGDEDYDPLFPFGYGLSY